MIIIDSECGRIGELWWINSEPGTPIQHSMEFVPGIHIRRRLIRWGAVGIGRHLRMTLEPINDHHQLPGND